MDRVRSRREEERKRILDAMAKTVGGPDIHVKNPELFETFLDNEFQNYQARGSTPAQVTSPVRAPAPVSAPAGDGLMDRIREILGESLSRPEPPPDAGLRDRLLPGLRGLSTPTIPEGFVTNAPEPLQPAARAIRQLSSPYSLALLPVGGARAGLVSAGGSVAGAQAGSQFGPTGEMVGSFLGGALAGRPVVPGALPPGAMGITPGVPEEIVGGQAARTPPEVQAAIKARDAAAKAARKAARAEAEAQRVLELGRPARETDEALRAGRPRTLGETGEAIPGTGVMAPSMGSPVPMNNSGEVPDLLLRGTRGVPGEAIPQTGVLAPREPITARYRTPPEGMTPPPTGELYGAPPPTEPRIAEIYGNEPSRYQPNYTAQDLLEQAIAQERERLRISDPTRFKEIYGTGRIPKAVATGLPENYQPVQTAAEKLEAEIAQVRTGLPPPPPARRGLFGGGGRKPPGGKPPTGPMPPSPVAPGPLDETPEDRIIRLLRESRRLRPSISRDIRQMRGEGAQVGLARAATEPTAIGRQRAFFSGQAGRSVSQLKFTPVAEAIPGTEIIKGLPDIRPTTAAEALGVRGAHFEDMMRRIEDALPDHYESGNATIGLIRLLTGAAARPFEARLLERVFGRELAEAALKRYTGAQRTKDVLFDVGFLLPRALRSSWDASAPLRQGVIHNIGAPGRDIVEASHIFGGPPQYGRHTRLVAQAWADMFRVGFAKPGEAEGTARAIFADITDPTRNRWAEHLYTGPPSERLFLQNPEQPVLDFTAREEFFASRLAEGLPELGHEFKTVFGHRVPSSAEGAVRVAAFPVRVFGAGVRRSELMYATHLNEIRNATAIRTLDDWARAGEKITPENLAYLKRGVNILTGRGELGRSFQSAAKILSLGFWSPRLLASRIQAYPMVGKGLIDPRTRMASRELASALVSATVSGMTVLALADYFGIAEVELDRRSPNFGKLLIGRGRDRQGGYTIDFWGGFQQPIRYVSQMISGESKAITGTSAGQIQKEPPINPMIRFIRSKLSPGVPTLAGSELMGRTFKQEALRPSERQKTEIAYGLRRDPNTIRLDEAAQQYYPLFLTDIAQAIKDQGVGSFVEWFPGAFGVNVQSYGEDNSLR